MVTLGYAPRRIGGTWTTAPGTRAEDSMAGASLDAPVTSARFMEPMLALCDGVLSHERIAEKLLG